jgi:peptidoglycan/xylan/chitin deacetylase (PgdA/CDA1 family)
LTKSSLNDIELRTQTLIAQLKEYEQSARSYRKHSRISAKARFQLEQLLDPPKQKWLPAALLSTLLLCKPPLYQAPHVSAPHYVAPIVQQPLPQPPAIVRELRTEKTPILMVHHVDQEESRFVISPTRLWKYLDYLRNNDYALVRFDEFAQGYRPLGKRAAVLTFDDSTIDQYRIEKGSLDPTCALGVLERYKKTYPEFRVTATFFINTTMKDGTPAFEQETIRDKLEFLVNEGYEIGSHGDRHVAFAKLSAAQIRSNLESFEKHLHQQLPNYRVRSFAYPYGSLPDKERQAVVQEYYEFTAHAWGGTAKPMVHNVPRIEMNPKERLSTYAPRLSTEQASVQRGNVYKGEPNLMEYARSDSQLQAQHPQASRQSDDCRSRRRGLAREGQLLCREDSSLQYRQEGDQGRGPLSTWQQGSTARSLRDGHARSSNWPGSPNSITPLYRSWIETNTEKKSVIYVFSAQSSRQR